MNLEGIHLLGGTCWAAVHGVAELDMTEHTHAFNSESLLLSLLLLLANCLRWWRICLQGRRPWFDSWFGKMPWRKAWQPTPMFLPGESHEQRSLVVCTPWGGKELDMTERLTLTLTYFFFFFHFDFHTLNFWRERQKLYRNHTTALHFSASVPISGQCQSGTLFSDSESSPIHFNLALMLNGKDSHQKFLLLFCKVLDAHLCFYQGAWQLSVG